MFSRAAPRSGLLAFSAPNRTVAPVAIDDDATPGGDKPAPPVVSHAGVPLARQVAFRFTLDPTREQHATLMSHAGAARFTHNHQVTRIYANMDQRAAEKTYGLEGGELTPSVSWSKSSMINHMNQWKDGRAPDAPVTIDGDGLVVRGVPWRREVSAYVFEAASTDAARAFDNWWKSKTGKRKGPKVEPPRLKTRRHHRLAFRIRAAYSEGSLPAVRPAGPRALRFPVLGDIKVREATRKLRRMLDAGRLHITAASFSFHAGRWHVSIAGVAAELHHAVRGARGRHSNPVGVDVGVKTLAVAADSEGAVLHRWAGVKALQHAQAQLQAANRAYSRTKKGSRGHAKAKRRLGRMHARVANLRAALIHEITTTLARSCSTIVIEDLNVTGMVKNHKLARAVADAAFGEIRRQLAYKTSWYGSKLVVADRWFPSSKTCSACGHVNTDLTLADRTYRCEACGLVADRDVNAAINLARWTPPTGDAALEVLPLAVAA